MTTLFNRYSFVALMLIAFAVPAFNINAQEKAQQDYETREPAESDGSLQWKFAEGQVMKMNMDQETNMTIITGGRTMNSVNIGINELTVTITGVDSEGVATANNVIDRMVIGTQNDMVEFKYDSNMDTEPGTPAADIETMLKPMIGQAMSQKMSPNGKVFDVVVPEEMMAGIREANPMLAQMFTEKTFQDLATKSSLQFPDANPDVGTSWDVEATMDMGAAKVQTSTSYSYEGVTDLDGKPVHVIKGDIKMTFPDGIAGADIEITDEDSVVTYFFDGNAGRLVKSAMDQNVSMKIVAGGQEITQELEQKLIMDVTEGE